MIPSDTLKIAREIIKDEENWCKDYYAKDPSSKNVDPLSDRACKWCILGSVVKASSNELEYENITSAEESEYILECFNYLDQASWNRFNQPASIANDFKGHEVALEILDYAITLAEVDNR